MQQYFPRTPWWFPVEDRWFPVKGSSTTQRCTNHHLCNVTITVGGQKDSAGLIAICIHQLLRINLWAQWTAEGLKHWKHHRTDVREILSMTLYWWPEGGGEQNPASCLEGPRSSFSRKVDVVTDAFMAALWGYQMSNLQNYKMENVPNYWVCGNLLWQQ